MVKEWQCIAQYPRVLPLERIENPSRFCRRSPVHGFQLDFDLVLDKPQDLLEAMLTQSLFPSDKERQLRS
jgi:hypothetical protein